MFIHCNTTVTLTEVLEFLQEKWIKDPLNRRRKTFVAYSNLLRATLRLKIRKDDEDSTLIQLL